MVALERDLGPTALAISIVIGSRSRTLRTNECWSVAGSAGRRRTADKQDVRIGHFSAPSGPFLPQIICFLFETGRLCYRHSFVFSAFFATHNLLRGRFAENDRSRSTVSKNTSKAAPKAERRRTIERPSPGRKKRL